ncbi:regulatory LuxR family protein [Saccharopolyspora erythraea NRRL 2338]|uniref:LuxR family transcriptional regulator n=1 Tax=Saccharopolyspora erythraea TaxID=1836 RepID=A0ABN1DCM6_SACER|nr:regulatory LuxR family protein [Saccharopolyspora erythraea NRRL 2338]
MNPETILSGRTIALAGVVSCLDRVAAGSPAAVVLEGAFGSGKTRALDLASEHAHRAGLTAVRLPTPSSFRAGACSAVRDLWAFGPFAGRDDEPFAPEAVARAVLAARRTVLLVDDLHRLDEESLRWLGSVLDRLPDSSLGVVATAPRGEGERAGGPPAEVVARFSDRRALSYMDLAEVTELAEAQLGGPPPRGFAEECLHQTGGNPLLLNWLFGELRARAGNASGGRLARIEEIGLRELAEILANRYGSRCSVATEVIEAVALLAPEASTELVAGYCGLAPSTLAEVTDRLEATGVLERSGAGHAPAAPVIHRAVLAGMSPDRLEAAHVRAAALLHGEGAPAELVASHLLQVRRAEMPAWFCDVMHEHARGLVARGEPEQARRYLLRAVDRCTGSHRAEIFRELATIALRSDPPTARRYLHEALRLQADPGIRVRLRIMLANAMVMAGESESAVRTLRAGLDEIGGTDPRGASRLRQELRLTCLWGDLGEVAGPEANPGPEESGHRSKLVANALRCYWAGEDREQAAADAEEALETGPDDEHPASLLLPALVLARSGAFAAASTHVHRMLLEATAVDASAIVVHAGSVLAEILLHAGDLPACAQMADSAVEATSRRSAGEHPMYLGTAVASAVAVALATGDHSGAWRCLDGTGLSAEVPRWSPYNSVLLQRGRLHAAQGELDAALADLRECGRRMTAANVHNPAAGAWRSESALVHARMGHHDRAMSLVRVELEQARRWGAPAPIGQALRVMGLVSRDEARLAHLTEAVAVLRDSGARLSYAQALFDLGVTYRKLHRPNEARPRLRAALAHARHCGAQVLVHRASEQLAACRVRPQRTTALGVEALTPAERRVAVLAAEGRTNRQIAADLYVTRRTVELHLSRVYQKLLIPGRPALGRAMSSS